MKLNRYIGDFVLCSLQWSLPPLPAKGIEWRSLLVPNAMSFSSSMKHAFLVATVVSIMNSFYQSSAHPRGMVQAINFIIHCSGRIVWLKYFHHQMNYLYYYLPSDLLPSMRLLIVPHQSGSESPGWGLPSRPKRAQIIQFYPVFQQFNWVK